MRLPQSWVRRWSVWMKSCVWKQMYSAPTRLGAILDKVSIAHLNVPIVAGGANNQLATPEDGQRIFDRDILFAPDYVINSGGIISVALEYLDSGDVEDVNNRVAKIPERLTEIWEESAT